MFFKIVTTLKTLQNEKKQKRCSICGERKINSEKNNAHPINGRCCDSCYQKLVIPAKLLISVSEGEDLKRLRRYFNENTNWKDILEDAN